MPAAHAPSCADPLQDRSCERLAELALNDAEVAGALLRQAMQPCSAAITEAAGAAERASAFQRVSGSLWEAAE
jgi:hypothetical protein